MFANLKKLVKWGSPKHMESKKNQTSLLLAALIGLLEDILFWKKMWLSLSCIFFLNVIFFICIHQQINFLQFIFGLSTTIISLDAFETWLKHKHRTSCLKRLAEHDGAELSSAATQMKTWARRRWMEFTYLRETNNTKAFLLINILFTIIFLIGKYVSGPVLIYFMCIFLCTLHKLAPPVLQAVKKIQLNAESDAELEGLIPEASDLNIKLLSIEPEHPVVDDRQSLDYWKPEDLPLEEGSDSSDNSSSIITNLSMEKMQTLGKDVETSDSSEDEYIPIEHQKEQFQSTLEVVQPAGTWSNTAYNAFYNLTGAVANMVYSKTDDNKRNLVSSIDPSDGFEIIDKNDLN